MLDFAVNLAHAAVAAITTAVAPVCGPVATAVAIVLFTAAVRLSISPLSWAQVRGATVSPLAGCLPGLLQAPFFFVMYRLFTTPDPLLDERLAGVPLGQHVTDGLAGAAGPVFAVLFALLAVLAWWSSRRIRRAPAAPDATEQTESVRRIVALLPFGTLAVAVFVPLAGGLYLVTTTAWTALEQAILRPHP